MYIYTILKQLNKSGLKVKKIWSLLLYTEAVNFFCNNYISKSKLKK